MSKYCKDCKFKVDGQCMSKNLCEDGQEDKDSSGQLVYSYMEGGYFTVGDYFGCVHFEWRNNE